MASACFCNCMNRKRTTVLDPGVKCASTSAMWVRSSQRGRGGANRTRSTNEIPFRIVAQGVPCPGWQRSQTRARLVPPRPDGLEGRTAGEAGLALDAVDLDGGGESVAVLVDFLLLRVCIAQGLRRAITDVFGSRGVVQRCQVHKCRNVLGHLPSAVGGP